MEERSKTIDILRALAVLLVLGRHMSICPVEFWFNIADGGAEPRDLALIFARGCYADIIPIWRA
jgi:hypothetical protein